MKVYKADIKLLINTGTDLTNNVSCINTTNAPLLGTLSVQSILNKSCDIVDLIADRQLDILILSETWYILISSLCALYQQATKCLTYRLLCL